MSAGKRKTHPPRYLDDFEHPETLLDSDVGLDSSQVSEINWTDSDSSSVHDSSGTESEDDREDPVEDDQNDDDDDDQIAGPSTTRSTTTPTYPNIYIDIPTYLLHGPYRENEEPPNQFLDYRQTTNNFELKTKDNKEIGVQWDVFDNEVPTELMCFESLFTLAIRDMLQEYINDYARVRVMKNTPPSKRSRFGKWTPITDSEICKLLAVITSMGMDSRPSIRDYWTEFLPFYTPWYKSMFERERFETIYCSMLHAGEKDALGKAKIEPMINLLCNQFTEMYVPTPFVSIDEMVIGYKGRWKYKQYNATKPHKYHIKSFGLVDSSNGYVLNVLIYLGSEKSYNPITAGTNGSAEKVFGALLPSIGTGYHVFADRWYTTKKLVDYMLENEQYYSGTVQTNRVGFPAGFKTEVLKHMEHKYWASGDNKILCCAFKDKEVKKPVLIVSTKACAEEVSNRKGK